MYLDLSCPLELLGYELLRDDHNKVRAYLSLNNLSQRRIERIAGDILWRNAERDERINAPFIADELRASPKGPFKLQLSTDYMPDADQLELVLNRIHFADGSLPWVGDKARLMRIEEPLIPAAQELNRLVAAAGVDARSFPLRTSNYWICVCGRPNRIEDNKCARCQREKLDVFENFSRKAVLSNVRALPGAVPEPEIPSFLDADDLDRPSLEEERQALLMELSMLNTQCKSQRNMLIRRSIFLIAAILIVCMLVQAFEWLGEKQQQAKDIHPPVRASETASPELNHSRNLPSP